MSLIGDAFTYSRRLILLDSEVQRLTSAVDTMTKELAEHDRRLIRIETLIEFSRPRLPRD